MTARKKSTATPARTPPTDLELAQRLVRAREAHDAWRRVVELRDELESAERDAERADERMMRGAGAPPAFSATLDDDPPGAGDHHARAAAHERACADAVIAATRAANGRAA